MRGRVPIVAAALLCASGAAAAAEEQTICAARPGKSTPTCTVPAGHFQIETGLADWSLSKDEGLRITSLVIGETTFKYGLTDRSDIEVDVTPWQRATASFEGSHTSDSGFGDTRVAFKQQLTSSNAPVQLSALPYVKIPTAPHSLGNGKWEGGLLIPIGYSIPKSPFSIGLTPELDWAANGDANGHHLAMVQVASIGWQVNDRLSLSGDIWGEWDWDPSGTSTQASADGSIAYLLSNKVQLDAGANFGLNRNTPDIELYTGASVLF